MEADLAKKIEELQRYGFSFAPGQIIAAAIQLEIFPLIEQAKTPEEVARERGMSIKGVRRLLDALRALGILIETEGSYKIEPQLRELFLPESPLYMGSYFLHLQALHKLWSHLPQSVISGRPVERKRDPKFPVNIAKGLFPLNWFQALMLGKQKELPERGNVLDVAGGSGVWSSGILIHRPELKGTLLDLPPVVEEAAKPTLKRIGLLSRYTFIPGDMFETPWGEGYACVILGHICHALGEDGIVVLIEKARKALAPQGILIIIDFFPTPEGTFSSIFALNMLLATEQGGVHDQETYERCLRKGGFSLQKLIPLTDSRGSTAIIATPGTPLR